MTSEIDNRPFSLRAEEMRRTPSVVNRAFDYASVPADYMRLQDGIFCFHDDAAADRGPRHAKFQSTTSIQFLSYNADFDGLQPNHQAATRIAQIHKRTADSCTTFVGLGLGLTMQQDMDILCFDLDNKGMLSPPNGLQYPGNDPTILEYNAGLRAIEDHILDIFNRHGAVIELSRGGKGYHIFFRSAKLANNYRAHDIKGQRFLGGSNIFHCRQYVALTGWILGGAKFCGYRGEPLPDASGAVAEMIEYLGGIQEGFTHRFGIPKTFSWFENGSSAKDIRELPKVTTAYGRVLGKTDDEVLQEFIRQYSSNDSSVPNKKALMYYHLRGEVSHLHHQDGHSGAVGVVMSAFDKISGDPDQVLRLVKQAPVWTSAWGKAGPEATLEKRNRFAESDVARIRSDNDRYFLSKQMDREALKAALAPKQEQPALPQLVVAGTDGEPDEVIDLSEDGENKYPIIDEIMLDVAEELRMDPAYFTKPLLPAPGRIGQLIREISTTAQVHPANAAHCAFSMLSPLVSRTNVGPRFVNKATPLNVFFALIAETGQGKTSGITAIKEAMSYFRGYARRVSQGTEAGEAAKKFGWASVSDYHRDTNPGVDTAEEDLQKRVAEAGLPPLEKVGGYTRIRAHDAETSQQYQMDLQRFPDCCHISDDDASILRAAFSSGEETSGDNRADASYQTTFRKSFEAGVNYDVPEEDYYAPRLSITAVKDRKLGRSWMNRTSCLTLNTPGIFRECVTTNTLTSGGAARTITMIIDPVPGENIRLADVHLTPEEIADQASVRLKISESLVTHFGRKVMEADIFNAAYTFYRLDPENRKLPKIQEAVFTPKALILAHRIDEYFRQKLRLAQSGSLESAVHRLISRFTLSVNKLASLIAVLNADSLDIRNLYEDGIEDSDGCVVSVTNHLHAGAVAFESRVAVSHKVYCWALYYVIYCNRKLIHEVLDGRCKHVEMNTPTEVQTLKNYIASSGSQFMSGGAAAFGIRGSQLIWRRHGPAISKLPTEDAKAKERRAIAAKYATDYQSGVPRHGVVRFDLPHNPMDKGADTGAFWFFTLSDKDELEKLIAAKMVIKKKESEKRRKDPGPTGKQRYKRE